MKTAYSDTSIKIVRFPNQLCLVTTKGWDSEKPYIETVNFGGNLS